MSNIDPSQQIVFQRDHFEVTSLEQAMAKTVTAEFGDSTDARWSKEAQYLVDDIGKHLSIGPDSCILDYGCGTGRISKELIDRFGCRAIGIDSSKSMRLLSPEYVLSDRYNVWSPETLDKMIDKGFRVDSCISLWVIQHAFDAIDVIGRILRVMRPGGLFYTLNQYVRCVPTNLGWANDGFDVQGTLRRVFSEEDAHPLPLSVVTPDLAAISTIQVLRKRAE